MHEFKVGDRVRFKWIPDMFEQIAPNDEEYYFYGVGTITAIEDNIANYAPYDVKPDFDTLQTNFPDFGPNSTMPMHANELEAI